ncbi:MAG: hypothetical protein J0I98_06700 [Mesorhizobium sp.]|nr:hypothetical protein [Mesorhizobium sp.]MBN9242464.1 hypothetical protein [Mesorhizobium sp.]
MTTFQNYRRAVGAMGDLQAAVDDADAEIGRLDAKIARLQARRDDIARERAALSAGAADIGRRVGLISFRQAAE